MRGSHKVALLTFVSFLSQACATLTGVFLARYLSQDSYGTYRQAYLIISTFSVFFVLGIPASLLYFLPGLNPEEKKGFLIQTIIFLLVLGFLGSITAFFMSGFISVKFNNPELKQIMSYFSFCIMFEVTCRYISAFFMGIDKYKKSSGVQVIINITRLSVVLTALFFKPGIALLLKIMTCYMAVQTAVLIFLSIKEMKGIKIKWRKGFIKQQLAYAIPLGMSSMVWVLGEEIDKYCMAVFFLPQVFAVYVVGALDIPVLKEINMSIMCVIVPKIAEFFKNQRKNEILSLWKEANRKLMLIIIPSFGVLFLAAVPLIVTLYGAGYEKSAMIFRVYICVFLCRIFNASSILQAIGKTKIVLITSFGFVFINTVLNIVFIKVFKIGVFAPAVATTIAALVTNLTDLSFAIKYMNCSFKDIFPVADCAKISFATLSSALLTFIILPKLNNYFIMGLSMGTIFAVLFLSMAFILRVYTKDDIMVFLCKQHKAI